MRCSQRLPKPYLSAGTTLGCPKDTGCGVPVSLSENSLVARRVPGLAKRRWASDGPLHGTASVRSWNPSHSVTMKPCRPLGPVCSLRLGCLSSCLMSSHIPCLQCWMMAVAVAKVCQLCGQYNSLVRPCKHLQVCYPWGVTCTEHATINFSQQPPEGWKETTCSSSLEISVPATMARQGRGSAWRGQ